MYRLPDEKVRALQRVAGRLGDSGWLACTSEHVCVSYRMKWVPVHGSDAVSVDGVGGPDMYDVLRKPQSIEMLDLWALGHLADVVADPGIWVAKESLR